MQRGKQKVTARFRGVSDKTEGVISALGRLRDDLEKKTTQGLWMRDSNVHRVVVPGDGNWTWDPRGTWSY